ncbi:hypothetical protein EON65_15470 [archaeon]|nr:MAG: hypothetical protein EON65_15470 [archaeon]
MIQAVGAFDTCITVPVRDRKIIVADKEVKMDNCQGTWNQLFRLPSSSSTGFILQQPWDQSANPEQSYCLEYLPALQSTNTVVAIVACKYSAIGQFFALEDLTTD